MLRPSKKETHGIKNPPTTPRPPKPPSQNVKCDNLRITSKKENPDYEKIRNNLAQIVHIYLDEVPHDIIMEQLYDWLEYTHKLESEIKQLKERVEVIQEVVGFKL